MAQSHHSEGNKAKDSNRSTAKTTGPHTSIVAGASGAGSVRHIHATLKPSRSCPSHRCLFEYTAQHVKIFDNKICGWNFISSTKCVCTAFGTSFLQQIVFSLHFRAHASSSGVCVRALMCPILHCDFVAACLRAHCFVQVFSISVLLMWLAVLISFRSSFGFGLVVSFTLRRVLNTFKPCCPLCWSLGLVTFCLGDQIGYKNLPWVDRSNWLERKKTVFLGNAARCIGGIDIGA